MFFDKALNEGLKVINKFVPDKDQQAQAEAELRLAILAATTDINKAQSKVNEAEAKSASLFIAGWRPCIGWICAICLGYHFLINPLLLFIFAILQYNVAELPKFDMDSLITLVIGLLGMGGMRTFEKIKGVERKSLF